MQSILDDLFQNWDYLNKGRDAELFRERGYRETEEALEQAEQALDQVLGPEHLALLERYGEAQSAASALYGRVSMRFGARCCLRLLLELLTRG